MTIPPVCSKLAKLFHSRRFWVIVDRQMQSDGKSSHGLFKFKLGLYSLFKPLPKTQESLWNKWDTVVTHRNSYNLTAKPDVNIVKKKINKIYHLLKSPVSVTVVKTFFILEKSSITVTANKFMICFIRCPLNMITKTLAKICQW